MGVGLLSVSKHLDYVVSGEGEETFKSLLEHLFTDDGIHQQTVEIPGVYYRSGSRIIKNPAPQLITDFSRYPPMYCESYFSQVKEIADKKGVVFPRGPVKFEMSRGCWWGEHSQCTFCGLNGLGMTYRPKKPDRIIEELTQISSKFRTLDFLATDNILNTAFLLSVFKVLDSLPYRLNIFLEIKANLTKDHIEKLAYSGVSHVQPGIESLSSHTLKIMKKGSNMLTNIQILKWLTEYNVNAVWNLLYGFPGESIDDFITQFNLIPLLKHLQPPAGGRMFRIEMYRFSPNFDNFVNLGFKNIRPLKDYQYLYPNEDSVIRNLAYFFDYETVHDKYQFEPIVKEINNQIGKWAESKKSTIKPVLFLQEGPNFVHITDTRKGTKTEVDLIGYSKEIMLLCDGIATYDKLKTKIMDRFGEFDKAKFERAISNLKSIGLVLQENDKYLSLAIFLRKAKPVIAS